MKQFLTTSFLFALLIPVVLHIKPLYLMYNNKYQRTVAGNEIYYSITKSKKQHAAKKLVLGDSVGKQLFSNTTNTDSVNSLACNQSIGVVGQYLLLNNYIHAGNKLDTVYLFFHPTSFGNNLNQEYTYHYFLKPFYTHEYQPLFTPTIIAQINKIPYANWCHTPYVLTSNWAPNYVCNDVVNYTFLSPISVEYLTKIKQLSAQYNFVFIIVPTPVSISFKTEIDAMQKAEIANAKLTNEFANYFNTIEYLNNNLFKDSIHLKNPDDFTAKYKRKFYSNNF
jgi:hypothetical protein